MSQLGGATERDLLDLVVSSMKRISLDWWAVIVALLVALLLKLGIIRGVPW